MDFGFELELEPTLGEGGLEPGESGEARLSIWAVEELPSLSPDQKFETREGARIEGYGSVVQT